MPTRSTTARKTKKDAIALLKQDHEMVKDMLSQLEKIAAGEATDEQRSEQLLREIEAELRVHSQVEEEIFYPAFKEATADTDDVKLYYEALEEHHVVDLVLPEIPESPAGTPDFAAKVKVLKDLVTHHVKEEEGQLFPKAKRALGKDELERLADQIDRRKTELSESGAHEDGA
jgi:hemerythrin-like domain-containing protein